MVNRLKQTPLSSLVFVLFSLFFCFSDALAANIQAEVDRRQVSLNESFTLVFTTDGEEDGDPDFRPLEQHFEILAQNESSNMSFINGEITKIKQWTLTLMGKQPGFFTIPEISFGSDRSPVIRIDIKKTPPAKPGQPSEPIFIEVSASPENAYVQSQVIYTVRLHIAVNLLSAQLSEPSLSEADAVIEKLGEDRKFETTVSNKRYKVIERRYAIFPQRSGQFTIAPISFAGQLSNRSSSNFSPFPGGGAIKRLRSREIQLNVKPVPQDKIRGRWLPAKNLRLVEVWPENTAEPTERPIAGEPLTWKIMLMADGLTSAQLPEIAPKLPKGIKSYPDQAVLNNEKRDDSIIGIRQETIDLIPGKAGTYRLPAVEVPWWNTITEKMEVARLPARQIEIAAAETAEQPASIAPLPTPLLQESPDVDSEADGGLSRDAGRGAAFWSWISLILGLGWAITLVAWWGSRQKPRTDLPPVSDAVALDMKHLNRQVKEACTKNEADAVKAALLSWGRVLWPGRPISLGEIKNKVGEALAGEIEALNSTLYGRQARHWESGSALWSAFEQEQRKTKQKPTAKQERLAPMVPGSRAS